VYHIGMKQKKHRVNRLDYCQYLLVSQINYTITHYAEHTKEFSHDEINRYLAQDAIRPHFIWENSKVTIVQTASGYIIFDDVVIDKDFSKKIALVRRQYSGNTHTVIKGIGVVTCIYVNPLLNSYWVIDFRIYDPDGDGKTKLDHVKDMLLHTVYSKQLLFQTVLMDTWYATKNLMLLIDTLGKTFYCPLKKNRNVDDTEGLSPYQRVDNLVWTDASQKEGKCIKIHKFPKTKKVKLFRVALSTQRTEYIVTNDMEQDSVKSVQEVYGFRWKIEQFHRELKQLTGIEKNQCRKARIVRNHIGCALLVWIRLKQVAEETRKTLYQVKHGLLGDYLRSQLDSPTIKMCLA
jgi:hypothetical protein